MKQDKVYVSLILKLPSAQEVDVRAPCSVLREGSASAKDSQGTVDVL